MTIRGLNHLAFITNDLEKTIRFYRDLLGLTLSSGIGHDGFRHYFFQMGDAAGGGGQIAFFEYEGARPMKRSKFHGSPTREPVGFDHVALTVDSKEDLFALKDGLEAAGINVQGAVDHGTLWSIYFFDPQNNIPLEISWDCLELLQMPAIEDDAPLAVAAEGAAPQPGYWPAVTRPTAPEAMTAQAGNGHPMRQSFIRRGLARPRPGLPDETPGHLSAADPGADPAAAE